MASSSERGTSALLLHPVSGIIGPRALMRPADVRAEPVDEGSFDRLAAELRELEGDDVRVRDMVRGEHCRALADGCFCVFPGERRTAPCQGRLGSLHLSDASASCCPCCDDGVVLVSWDTYEPAVLGHVVDELMLARSRSRITGVLDCAIVEGHVVVRLDHAPRCSLPRGEDDARHLRSALDRIHREGLVHGGLNERWLAPRGKDSRRVIGLGLAGLYGAWRRHVGGLDVLSGDPESWDVADPRFVSPREITDGGGTAEGDRQALASILVAATAETGGDDMAGRRRTSERPWELPIRGVNAYFRRVALEPNDWLQAAGPRGAPETCTSLFPPEPALAAHPGARSTGVGGRAAPAGVTRPEDGERPRREGVTGQTGTYPPRLAAGKGVGRSAPPDDDDDPSLGRARWWRRVPQRVLVVGAAVLISLLVGWGGHALYAGSGSQQRPDSAARDLGGQCAQKCVHDNLVWQENKCVPNTNVGKCSSGTSVNKGGQCIADASGSGQDTAKAPAGRPPETKVYFQNASLRLSENDRNNVKRALIEDCPSRGTLHVTESFLEEKGAFQISNLRTSLSNILPPGSVSLESVVIDDSAEDNVQRGNTGAWLEVRRQCRDEQGER